MGPALLSSSAEQVLNQPPTPELCLRLSLSPTITQQSPNNHSTHGTRQGCQRRSEHLPICSLFQDQHTRAVCALAELRLGVGRRLKSQARTSTCQTSNQVPAMNQQNGRFRSHLYCSHVVDTTSPLSILWTCIQLRLVVNGNTHFDC